jgi:hypothetical protein
MRRDRTGEPMDELEDIPASFHPADCVAGWLGDEDHPRPCPVCRPTTVARLRRQRELIRGRA